MEGEREKWRKEKMLIATGEGRKGDMHRKQNEICWEGESEGDKEEERVRGERRKKEK